VAAVAIAPAVPTLPAAAALPADGADGADGLHRLAGSERQVDGGSTCRRGV
jgi:hypothetical protein